MLPSITQPTVSATISTPIEIIFGYQGPDCQSRGICRMETPLEMAKLADRFRCENATIKATLHYYPLIDRLNLSIELNAIDQITWRNQFATGFLELNRPHSIAKSILIELGIASAAIIPRSSYPYQVIANRIEFILPLVIAQSKINISRKMIRTLKTSRV